MPRRNLIDWVEQSGLLEKVPESLRELPDAVLFRRLREDMSVNTGALAQAAAEQLGLEFSLLNDVLVSDDAMESVPLAEAMEYSFALLALDEHNAELAIADPYDLDLIDRIERATGRQVVPIVSTAEAIHRTLSRSYGEGQALKGLSEDFRVVVVHEDADGKEQPEALDVHSEVAAPVVRLVNTLLHTALQRRASDVHVEATEHGVNVKYRIDGVLYAATETLDIRHHAALISRLKVMAQLDIAEKRVPQDGRFKLRLGDRDVDFRVSVLPSVFGEDVVIRVLDRTAMAKTAPELSLDFLGFDEDTRERFRRAVHEPYGMVLITGPTGSGKTTTLYAALRELHTGEEKIITIEDPVEYRLDGVVQVPVNEKKGLTFARGLRSILRHDPDKIMVGEIRDPETARIAVQSALTGHLVFTTVHANNVFDVISRFAHMGADVHSFVSSLNCVMAQRLIRLLCDNCKERFEPSKELLDYSRINQKTLMHAAWYRAVGCQVCGDTGYKGRIAIAEFLTLSPRIRELIAEKAHVTRLREAAEVDGFQSLREAAVRYAVAGKTTLQEINRTTFSG